MLSERQKAIISLCRSADQCINTSCKRGGAFFLGLMFVSGTPPFTEFLALQKRNRHVYITHVVKPGLVIKKSGVTNEEK